MGKGEYWMYVNETKIRVRYAETDKMGIVYHANYYIWFEVARTEFIRSIGMSYKVFEENGILIPLIECSCKYFEGATYDDEVIIQSYIEKLSSVRIVYNYNVIRASDNKLLAKGSTIHAIVNSEFKIINLKKANPVIWDKIEKLYIELYVK